VNSEQVKYRILGSCILKRSRFRWFWKKFRQ